MEENQKLLARFSPQPFYFLTWKGNTELLIPLNKAMSQVQNTYPTFLDDLLVSHYPIYKIQFYSREEVEYVLGSMASAFMNALYKDLFSDITFPKGGSRINVFI